MSADAVGTTAVQERHRFDAARLEAFLTGRIEGFRGPLTVEQFKGGQSNPTYLLDTPTARYVLRAQAPGQAAALGARGRPRIPGDHGAAPGRAFPCRGLTCCARTRA